MTFRTRGYGDVVLFKGNDKESRIIEFFLQKMGDSTSPYVHSALRTRRHRAESIGFRGYQVYNLNHPPEWCDEFVILRHKDMTSSKRRELRKLNRICSRNYDWGLILKLGFNSFIPQNSISDDLSTENEYTCTSRIALMYNLLKMSVIEGVHYSQINPEHFIDGGNFEVMNEWKRTY